MTHKGGFVARCLERKIIYNRAARSFTVTLPLRIIKALAAVHSGRPLAANLTLILDEDKGPRIVLDGIEFAPAMPETPPPSLQHMGEAQKPTYRKPKQELLREQGYVLW